MLYIGIFVTQLEVLLESLSRKIAFRGRKKRRGWGRNV